jgi:hypothetical protein
MALYQLKSSFAGGELSPSMYGRTDIAKYDSGAATLRNFLVLRYGGAANRPGFKFIAQTYNNKKAVLIPFMYSTDQNYIVEITAGRCRFYKDGDIVRDDNGSPYSIENFFVDKDLEDAAKIKYTQSADVLFIVHPEHAPMTLTRYGELDWRFERMDITGGPFDDAFNFRNATNKLDVSASAVSGNVTITATSNIFSQEDVGSLFAITQFLPTDYKKAVPNNSGSNLQVNVLPKSSVYVESFGFWDGSFNLEKYDEASDKWTNIRTQSGNRSQNYNFTEENTSESIVSYRVTSNEFNTGVWDGENEKQRGYITIQSIGGDYTGYVLITEYVSPTVVNGTVKKQLASTSSTKDFSFAAWNDKKGYPAATGFYEDRLIFAGTKGMPQTFWSSKTGDYYNFGVNIPALDEDAVTGTLNGGQMNGIKAIIAFGEMILLTSGGEYKVSGGGKPLTGSNVLSQPQEYRGVSDVNPVTVGSRIVYVQQQGNIIRDLAYSYDVDKYTGDDLNLLAAHLFEGHKIISMTYQQIPNSIIWCVRDDGLLLGLTYLKEQDIYAWHQHSISSGKFINVCSISGKTEDTLYAVIERAGKYYVEIMSNRDKSTNVEDQFFVDSGITYEGEPTDEISGLEHLEGYTVAILADGNVLPQQTVENGKVVLGNKYKKVHVGLPIDAEIKTLPIDFTAQDGTYLSRKKRIASFIAMLKDSRGGVYGMRDDALDEIKWRSNEAYGEPIALKTEKVKIVVKSASWSETQQVIIKQPDPLPMTVLSLIPEIEG